MSFNFSFHHFIFSTFPILFLFLDNMHELQIQDIILPLIISILIITIFWILLSKVIGKIRASLILSFTIILLIIFSQLRILFFYQGVDNLQFLGKLNILGPIIVVIGIIGIIFIIKKNPTQNIASITNVISLAVIGFIILQVGMFSMENNVTLDEFQEAMNVSIFEADESIAKPDVYFLMLDAYSGEIILDMEFGYDNSEFYKNLEKRGFVVQKQSFSNYPNTEFSMPSITNMAYFDEHVLKPNGVEYSDVKVYQQLTKNSIVSKNFRVNGYELHSVAEIDPSLMHNSVIHCRNVFNLNQDLLNTILNIYLPLTELRYILFETDHYQFISCAIEKVKNFEKTNDSPIFMFAHFGLPHPPFIFDSDGNKIDEVLPVEGGISEMVVSKKGFNSKYTDAYVDQVKFSQKVSIEMIDSIQEKNSNSVIILMSDHGSRIGTDWENPSDIDYFSALNNLSAVYFPGKEGQIPTEIAAVNLFRIFFNLYFDADYEILDERYIWYTESERLTHIDITEKINTSSLLERNQ